MNEASTPPKTIGRYLIRSELGGGGMGDVYRVWDPDTRRELALKVLKFTYPRALHYFKREFRAVASLSHPNLVTLYDLHFENEQYFYTMDIVDGTDLYVYVNGHNRIVSDTKVLCSPSRLDRVKRTVVQLLRGLAFLHHHNRVHRDIKPSNILVDREGRVSLVDFGIVKELIPGGEGQSLSQVFGTSTYFSPEQSLGSNVGPAADLYSVGVVLYELLAGVPPFTGESVDVALAHRNTPPPSLVQRVPGSSPELILVCMALLKKDPLQRPSAREALEMLHAQTDFHSPVTEFIGRVPARRQLHSALSEVQSGEGRFVLIEGESGVGKTALVECFTREARLFGASFFTGTCVQRDHVPMRGLDTIVERMAEAYRRETARIMRRLSIGERAALIDGFEFLGELLPPEEHGDYDGRSSPASGLRRTLTGLAQKRLIVIVLEHLHLADDAVCEVLSNLQTGGAPPPVLFVVTIRSEAVEPHGRIAEFLEFAYAQSQTRRVPLEAFTEKETRQYITEHLVPAPVWASEYVQEQTGGSPLLVSTMVEAIKGAPLDAVPTLEQTISRQVNSLDETAQITIKALAINRGPLSVVALQEACAMDMDTVYAAVRQLTARQLAELATGRGGETIVVGRHATLMSIIRNGLPTDERPEWHRALAYAHQATRGAGTDISYHWDAAGEPTKMRTYVERETQRARTDGDHPRAIEMIRVSLGDDPPLAMRKELLGSLIDSLSRCGRFLEAAQTIDELATIDEDLGYALQGRRCQLYLLAGQIQKFRAFADDLPPIARVPLADALLDFLPSDAEVYLAHVNDPWGDLVRARLLCERSDDRASAQIRNLLDGCDESVVDAGPQGQGQRALAWACYYRALGQSDQATQILSEVTEDVGEAGLQDNLLAARITLMRAGALLDHGLVSAARRLVGPLLRFARAHRLSSIQTLACCLQARASLEAGDLTAADLFIEEASRTWPAKPWSLPHALIALVRAQHALYQRNFDEAVSALGYIEHQLELAPFFELRSIHREYVVLRARTALCLSLRAWRCGAEPDDAIDTLISQLRQCRPRPTGWIGFLSSLPTVFSGQTQDALEQLDALTESMQTRAVSAVEMAGILGWTSAIRESRGQGGGRDWARAVDMLRAAGASLPPEMMMVSKPDDDGK
ncbi:MAG: serine/threonine-protein kinase [Myxococcota bacterium]|nr:serine/threonine-protein kinase [Myxococcota bacterium]